jgi:hypothetical protein
MIKKVALNCAMSQIFVKENRLFVKRRVKKSIKSVKSVKSKVG